MGRRVTTHTVTRTVRPWRLDCHVTGSDDLVAAEELRRCLTNARPTLPARWFYDDTGGTLFERITTLDEYYQTRTEQRLLDAAMDDVVAAVRPTELVEIGSGAARKTRAILDAMQRAGSLHRYVPFDISPACVAATAANLSIAYPGLRVHGVAGDFSRHLARIPRPRVSGTRLVAFLGGTIGNLGPRERRTLMRRISRLLRPGDAMLLGTDLAHDPVVLVRAYDDSAGITAAFNRNAVRHINRVFAGDADPDAFAHEARWNSRASRVEMHLAATRPITWAIPGLGITVHLAEGATIRTEIACKFSREAVLDMYDEADLTIASWHEDDLGRYALSVATAA
ncbi:MAG: L-histidine N(alpha)-methyltransferase [Thermoleophilia bacterium]|nr:L-histidine N(alpha)-methyltransferase [Thermoleophilia bacterium]